MSWSAVIEFYREIQGAGPIARLAEAIAASPYADRLFPRTSMLDLVIYNDPSFTWWHDCLVVRFDPGNATFMFEYIEHPLIKKRWRKECSADEAFSAFIHFLRLKRWFPVAGIPEGSWTWDVTS